MHTVPDYARVVFGIISFYYMPFDHIKASVFYFLSYILDEFDGWAARKFNQGELAHSHRSSKRAL